jgi:hypothetical protein
MSKPNKKFNLDVKDVEQIETALRLKMNMVEMSEKKEINLLLGKLYNQKQFYRPSHSAYISG